VQNRCAGESTELRTMPTEDNQRTCFSVARVDLSEGMGVQLDYARIMVTRLSERPYCVQLLSARKRKHGKLNLQCPPTNVRKPMPNTTLQERPHPEGVSSRSTVGLVK